MIRPVTTTIACVAVAIAANLSAQPPASEFDPAAVERGQQLLSTQCGFCHGANARGGSSGPDLTRSALVQTDEGGTQLGQFLRVGRPDRGMPAFDFTDAQMADLAVFLHSAIRANANRRAYRILDVLVGDARAGEAYFNGAGRCATCHSPQRDLRGIGARYDPPTLQNRMVLPRGAVAAPNRPPEPAHLDRNAITATITTAGGESISEAGVGHCGAAGTGVGPGGGAVGAASGATICQVGCWSRSSRGASGAGLGDGSIGQTGVGAVVGTG